MSARGPVSGSAVALVTPMRDGEVDLAAFRALVRRQVEHGSDALVVCGTTGEAATLTRAERRSLVAATVEEAGGRVPVVAGVGTSCTRTTVEEARAAESEGADALLVVTPCYNRPSQRGLALHYGLVAGATPLPIVLYNVPGRTAVDLLPATVEELAARHANVVAIKEASGSVERLRELVRGGAVDVLAGDDHLVVEAMGAGAAGLVGVAANLLPREAAELVRAAAPGSPFHQAARAAELAARLLPLARLLFVETNPVPVKHALALLGLASAEVRPPLAPLAPDAAERLESGLAEAGLLAPLRAAAR